MPSAAPSHRLPVTVCAFSTLSSSHSTFARPRVTFDEIDAIDDSSIDTNTLNVLIEVNPIYNTISTYLVLSPQHDLGETYLGGGPETRGPSCGRVDVWRSFLLLATRDVCPGLHRLLARIRGCRSMKGKRIH